MFSVHCPRHRRRVLLGPTDIISVGPGPDGGFTLGYRCTCGHQGLSSVPGDGAGREAA
jgi:hypothetical protein